MIPSVIVVIVGDNMERKSMSYYRKWAVFDNNEQCPLRRDAVVIAEHGPPLAGQFGIIRSMPPYAFPATLCQMIMPKHSNRDTNDGGARRHTESSTGEMTGFLTIMQPEQLPYVNQHHRWTPPCAAERHSKSAPRIGQTYSGGVTYQLPATIRLLGHYP